MNRNLISLAGLLIAVASFTVVSTDAEAGLRRGRCCQNSGYQQRGFGFGQNRNWGSGCGQINNGCQPAAMTTACCTPQGAGYAQPSDGTAPIDNSVAPAVPVEADPAPKPAT